MSEMITAAGEILTATAGRSESTKQLEAAVVAVMSEVGAVEKTDVKALGYAVITEATIIQALRNPMIRAGLTINPVDMAIREKEVYVTKNGAAMQRYLLRVVFRLTHAASGEYADGVGIGEGCDNGDKGMNKAMTFALKYYLRQRFLLHGGDDGDDQPSDRFERAGKSGGGQQQRQQTGSGNRPANQPQKKNPDAVPADTVFKAASGYVAGAKSLDELAKYESLYKQRKQLKPEQLVALDAMAFKRRSELSPRPADSGGGGADHDGGDVEYLGSGDEPQFEF